jgi:hypothetical protein
MKSPSQLVGAALAVALIATTAFDGCMKSNGPVASGGSGVPVNLTMSFSRSSAAAPLLKTAGLSSVDSLRIDSIIVVVSQIRFLSPADSAVADSMGGGEDGGGDGHGDGGRHDGDDDGVQVTLEGPFVVHISDTAAVSFADQLLPAGTYDAVTFSIRRLMAGERHEDSDEHHRHMTDDDTSVVGSSVVIFGAVKKNGAWTPFAFNSDLELQFKIRGNFVVQQATGTVRIALNFNFGLLFRDPFTGAILDPLDTSAGNRALINQAIRFALGRGRAGHDRDGDGHPDD